LLKTKTSFFAVWWGSRGNLAAVPTPKEGFYSLLSLSFGSLGAPNGDPPLGPLPRRRQTETRAKKMEDELVKLFPIGSNGVLDLSPKERSWLTRKASRDDRIDFELLARFLASSEGQQVVELNLQGCAISDQSLQLLAPVVARSHHLRKLNLKNNDVKTTTMYVFISLLMEINTTLVELQIDDVKEKSALLSAQPATVATDLDDKTMRQQINPLVNLFNAFNSALHRVRSIRFVCLFFFFSSQYLLWVSAILSI
jgi:hypothetical protein